VTRSRLDLVTRDVRLTFLGVRPDLPLGHEHDDCHEEGDDHRREEPPARGDVQGGPAPRDAPENTEQQIPDQAVPSILLLRGRRALAAASPARFPLDFLAISS